MNRSCLDRKRFAALLREDWAARRTRYLVTLAAEPGAATAEAVWHAFWLVVASLFWLSAYRRMKKNDLKYQYSLNPKSV